MCHAREPRLWPCYTCQLFLRYKRETFIPGVLGFLKTTWSFPKIPEDVQSHPKTSEVLRAHFKCFSLQKSEIARKELSFIHFTHGFRSLYGFELHIFGSCVKQDGNNSHFWIRREKLARRREPAWDRSFQSAGVRLTPKVWELAGIPCLSGVLHSSVIRASNRYSGRSWVWLPLGNSEKNFFLWTIVCVKINAAV